MTEIKQMIEFKPITLKDKALYESYLAESLQEEGRERGCEYSFANLYLWGRQNAAVLYDNIVFFSQFDRRSVYPYPVGGGDKKAVLDAIIADAKARGIHCRITGLNGPARQTLEELYPGMFSFHCDEGSFDYVYYIDDLADLKGKKFHGKRNHLHRFHDVFPDYKAVPLSENNIPAVKKMIDNWYRQRMDENQNSDYHMEQIALEKAFRDYRELGMEGLAILNGDEVLAVTMGSRLYANTFDVHFEKAYSDLNGAYAAINSEFARYIREKYPEVQYLNREEDMGIEGLRKAKQSYHPHHMVEKCWARLLETGYDY